MSFNSFLTKLFGNKSQRDLKEIRPIVDKILKLQPTLATLSADELREKINEVRRDIKSVTEANEKRIIEIRAEVEKLEVDKRQPLWDELDQCEKNILDAIENKLNEHLPIVFATLRETAARFAKSPTVEVTATQLDRDLAAAGKDFVKIDFFQRFW